MKTMKLALLVLIAGCGGAPFTTGGDPPPAAGVDPPPADDGLTQVSTSDAGSPAAAATAPTATPAASSAPSASSQPPPDPPPATDAGPAPSETDACVPIPYSAACPAATSAWPGCGKHSDGCGSFYDCGEPCVEPQSSDAAGGSGDSCSQLTHCSGCALVGSIAASEQAPCASAVSTDDASGCQSYLSALRASQLCL
jgi:hypothetical protein